MKNRHESCPIMRIAIALTMCIALLCSGAVPVLADASNTTAPDNTEIVELEHSATSTPGAEAITATPEPMQSAAEPSPASAISEAAGSAADQITPAPTPEPTPTPAPTPEPQTVRVLLSRLGSGLNQLTVEIDGSYALDANESIRFARGAELIVSAVDGQLELSCGGLVMDMGNKFTLTRHATTGNNGLRFTQNSEEANLYEGELQFDIFEGSVRPILYINVEDYLNGVVPYEMSDSWPLEALKVQAIAARTYALRKRDASAAFDLYDSTRDQAFKGYNPEYVNAIKAVEETAGIVGRYNDILATLYYSAANGGQTDTTENVWGTSTVDYSYMPMKEDPYDLENPRSNLKTATVYKELNHFNQPPEALNELWKAALAEPLESMGYDADPENIVITNVLSIQPYKPLYAAPSRLYTMMRFRVKVMSCRLLPDNTDLSQTPPTHTQVPTATPILEPTGVPLNPYATIEPASNMAAPTLGGLEIIDSVFAIDLPIFDDIEDALGLSISKTDNELFTVAETDTAFTIESRRFGHGVGMSQRGAQWMAGHYNWTYERILEYYYPGVDFSEYPLEYMMRTAIKSAEYREPAEAPTPTPRPLPALLPVTIPLPEGAYYAEVSVSSDASTLNLRAEPSTSAAILATMRNGQTLIVLSVSTDGWAHVRTDTYEGYVSTQFIK